MTRPWAASTSSPPFATAPAEPWQYKVKLSEQTVKVSTPGVLQVRRWHAGGTPLADAIFDESSPCEGRMTIVDTLDMTRRRTIPDGAASEDLLVPVFRCGRKVYGSPDLPSIRRRAAEQLASFPGGVKRFVNPARLLRRPGARPARTQDPADLKGTRA